MEQFKPPSPLVLTGNLSEAWRRWEQRFQLYMTATGASEKDEEVKIAILLHTIGEEALEVYNTLNVTAAGEELTVEEVLTAFKNYCSPQKNVVFERHQFWSHPMSPGITVDRYITELRQKSKDCEFGRNVDDMIRDKLVFSINDTRLKERLLRDKELTLNKAIETCRSAEVAKSQIQAMQSAPVVQDASVDVLKKTRGHVRSGQNRHKTTSNNKQMMCTKCGNKHEPRQCPAYGATCHKCGKSNHFSKACRTNTDKNNAYKKTKTVNNIETEMDTLYIGMVCSDKSEANYWKETAKIKGVPISFKLDTGADVNVLPMHIYHKLPGPIQLQPTKTVLIAFGGSRIQADGILSLECKTSKGKAVLDFLVSSQADKAILGGQACEQLHLVKRVETLTSKSPKLNKPPATKEELVEKYAEVFTGLGEFPGVHHIHVDPNIAPVIHACRNVPLSIMDSLKKTLQDLEDRDVITPVSEPTEWVNSLVATQKKNGALRVCLDPCDLNEAVKRQHYSIPTHEDVRSKLAGKSVFTILDEKDGYWQIKLDESSSKLCTFNTPWGRYRFLRLPFGIKSASEVFQQKNCETFGDIPGVFIIADDMIIAAKSEREHDEILQKVMERAKAANVKFNKDKIQFKVDTVRYMGHVITSAGQKADDAKIKAIVDMPIPEDKQSLQRLLGMTKFLAQYIPNEASLTAPLRQLLKKDTVWQWLPHHSEALQTLKTALTQAPVLRFYDQNKPLTLQADSSKDGLGACLLQEGRPVCYASRALTDTEKRYAQIEKELLAIVFAAKRFHQYVYGRPVTVQSDHKPLEAIMRKPLCKAPARLQGMLLQLQRYDLTVTYTPGKLMYIADALSRATTNNEKDNVNGHSCEERVVYALEATDSLSEDTLNQLKAATAEDSVLQAVRDKHMSGWPIKRKSLDRALYSYWPMRNNINIQNDIVMVGDKIVIPQNFRKVILEKLHLAHQGVQRTKAKARKVLYWPGMAHDIETIIEKCAQCQQMQPGNQAEPLVPHPVPELPWMKIGADIFELHGQSYLLLVDYLTKYPEVLSLPDKTAYTVIQRMKSVFARHGIPKEIVSDHVPFASYEMKSFATSWEIKLTFSSPGFPSSNGMAERAIKTVKYALKKAMQTGTDPHLVLLSLRNTPVTGLNMSPAQMLMGRVLRSTLPCSSAVLKQSTPENVHDKIRNMQSRQKLHFDQRARLLPVFTPGNTVHMRTRRGWEPAVVIRQREEPRSYTVQTPAGRILRRNRRHLRKIHPSLFKETVDEQSDSEEQSPAQRSQEPSTNISPPAAMDNTPTCYTRSGRAVRRPARLPMRSLSKFAVCLYDQHLSNSPLMGHITHIVDQKLSSIDEARVLTALMTSVSSLVSPRLRDALISRADQLLDTADPSHFNVPRRMVQFLRNIKYVHRPLLEKCNEMILRNVPTLDAENIGIIMGLYQSLQFNNCDFKLAARQRLIELIDLSTDHVSFIKLFVALAPMASPEVREGLENTALLLADEFNGQQALAVAEALEEVQSRNLSLLNKIASVIQRNLHVYRSSEVARATQALFLLHHQNPTLFTTLRSILVDFLQRSVFPYEVTMLTRVLSMLPCPRLEDGVISRVDAVVEQCSLSDLNTLSFAVAKWVRNDPSYRHNTHSKYVRLLQMLNRCGHEKLQTADQLDLVLEELKFISGEWFEEMLLEETMVTLQRMIDQINWSNSPELSFFITRMHLLCPPLMDRIASVAIEHIDKIHYSATYAILLPFSVLNYDPVQADELYDACIKRFTPHISSFEPHLLVLLAYSLAVADRFPEELIREIFSVDFLGKLDSQLETLSDALNMRTRLRLMELNRAVCLECPEFQVPWFHERYWQHLQRKGNSRVSPVQQQIHKMLGEVLGGINCVQIAVVTPYCYTVDFECKLDKHSRPLPYSEPSTLQMLDRGTVHWDTSSLENSRDELPPGAQRVAVDFLDSRSFCKNSHHMKGEALMRKRHLEILGYRVIQIPHFEWNSMELSTHDAWKGYLKKKIFRKLSP